jgi:hypothetical protein
VATAYSDLVAGTAVSWKASAGDHVLTLTSLVDQAVREGDKSATLVDGTKGLPELLEFRLESAVGAAATAGKEVSLYVGESDSATAGTDNPGNLTGADAGVTSGTELLPQLNFVGSLVLSNARGTNVQKQRLLYAPTCAYLIPVLFNNSGQTLSATAGNHQLVMTPYYRRAPVA